MAKPPPDPQHLTAIFSRIKSNLQLGQATPIDATAWFLGPKGENAEALLEFVTTAANRQIKNRQEYMPQDPPIFTDYENEDHQQSIDLIRQALDQLLDELQSSIPLASYRNQSHMYWDITLPGAVGYFAAMLYNQNNVAAEASPVTTMLEVHVGNELCSMLGFEHAGEEDYDGIKPWGHITCDGSIANGESMWAARNLKFLPVALAQAIATEADLEDARAVILRSCQGRYARIVDLSPWELLNLPIDTVIGLVETIADESGINIDRIRTAVDQHSVQNLGLVKFQQQYLETYAQATPLAMVPATAHYSWPKTAAILGLGTDAAKTIEVDLDGRMCMAALRRELNNCLKRHQPVIQVVAVMGSTEEGAVDPLADIVKMRKEFQGLGLNFAIHVDGAWGGYFCSLLRPVLDAGFDPAELINDYPELYMSEHFDKHFSQISQADSVTLDPHKSGFIPYPAGGLCYRNGGMRDLIAYTAPVVFHGGVDLSVGSYGIEGSKPGAAAAAVYLSHKVIPLNQQGYGRLLGRCLFNSKRFYAALTTIDLSVDSAKNDDIKIQLTAFQRLPAERDGKTPKQVLEQKKYIAKNFVNCSTPALLYDVMGMDKTKPSEKQLAARALFQELGSDLSIVTYAFNFSIGKKMNRKLEYMNELNDLVFRELSLKPTEDCKLPEAKMFVTASAFNREHYGDALFDSFAERAGVEANDCNDIKFLISTTQNPWLSTTSDGNEMLGLLMDILHQTALEKARQVVDKHDLD